MSRAPAARRGAAPRRALPAGGAGPVGDQRGPALRPPGGARRRVRQGRRGGGGVLRGWASRGVEVGTVTPRPQPGQPGAAAVPHPGGTGAHQPDGLQQPRRGRDGRPAARARPSRPGPVGVNLGKNKDTPLERAVDDYVAGVERLGALADYVVVNASSPNTPGLRQLQEPEQLRALLSTVACTARGGRAGQAAASSRSPRTSTPRRSTPSSTWRVEVGIAGLICTNTTLARPGVTGPGRGRGGRTLRRSARPAGAGDAPPGRGPGAGPARALGVGRRLHRRRRAGAPRRPARTWCRSTRRSSTRGPSSSRGCSRSSAPGCRPAASALSPPVHSVSDRREGPPAEVSAHRERVGSPRRM